MNQSTKQIMASAVAGGGFLTALFGASAITLVGFVTGMQVPSDSERAKTVCFNPPETSMSFVEHAAKRAFICSFIPGIKVGEGVREAMMSSPSAPAGP